MSNPLSIRARAVENDGDRPGEPPGIRMSMPNPLLSLVVAMVITVAAGAAAAGTVERAGVPNAYSGAPGRFTSQAAPIPPGGLGECPGFIFRDGLEPGRLVQDGGDGNPIVYTTRGGYTILIDQYTITMTDPYGRNRVEHWGDPHENLNGKHIKDWGGAAGWDGSRRSVLLGDGTKVTMDAEGPQGVARATSIYDGHQNVQAFNATNTITHHGQDASDTRARDDAQYDGETSLFHTDSATGKAFYTNVYNEDAGFNIISFNVPLGETGGCANPNQVRDFFDDPRLGHT